MRKTYHFCLSSHDEVMFRSEADLNMGFNCLALAILETESRLLGEGFLTTHHHSLLQTDCLADCLYRSRYAYSRAFNHKYHRKGRLGERSFFFLEVEGLHHMTAALNYVLRQGLHHGIAETPFGYPHCSVNSFFKRQLGKNVLPEFLPASKRYQYLPSNVHLPEKYRMTASGLLLREDIVDVQYVEEIYRSAHNFLFQMNKTFDDKDEMKQKQENDTPPITMDAIESGVPGFSLKEARTAEFGKVNRSAMTDLELCAFIDQKVVPRYLKDSQPSSIYLIPESKRAAICERMWNECRQMRFRNDGRSFFSGRYVTEAQLRRCLCV